MTVSRVFLDCGGRVYRVNTYGQEFLIELHPYCGPLLVDEDFSEITGKKPRGFWQAVAALNKMDAYRAQLIEVGATK